MGPGRRPLFHGEKGNMAAFVSENKIDYSRKWYVMAAVAMGIFLATIDGSIVNVALPTLVEELGTEFSVVQWVVLAYLLVITTLLLSIGRLADMIGKKPLYTTGFIIFTIGSALCGLSPTVYWLIGARVLQAFGAAMTTSLGMAIITEAFPASERGRAIGIGGLMVSLGIVIGPTLGGLIIDALSWHWIFLVNLPVGVVGTLMVLRFVPNFKPRGGQRFDFLGACTMFITLISLLLGLTMAQQIGFDQPIVWALVLGSFVFLGIFLMIERRAAQPLIDFSMFESRLFSVNLITGAVTFISIAGVTILMPFYLQGVLGYSPREVGLLLAPLPIAMGLLAPISGAMSDKYGARPITVLGLFVILLSFIGLATLNANTTAVGYGFRYLILGMGFGIFQSPNNSAIMGAVRRERLGVASSLLSLTRTMGQTVGVAIIGALWAGRVAFYYGELLEHGATTAPAVAQVAGLNDTFAIVSVFVSMGLALSVWGLVQERRHRRAAALAGGTPAGSGNQ
jgi:EmrB/QacA subfamily drug resistance transporter